MEEKPLGFLTCGFSFFCAFSWAHSPQWPVAESLPAYSGGTVLDLHQLPHHNHLFSFKEPSSFVKKINKQ